MNDNNPKKLIMVFYGRKKSGQDHHDQQYRSIKEQILKQLGERITPVYQKSLATIFSDLGDKILIATQSVLNIAQNFKTTELYDAYESDKQTFKQEFKDEKQWYDMLSKRLTENKFYLIKNYSCESRIFFLNTAVFITGVMAIRLNKTFTSKIRSLISTCLFGYGIGGIFIAPEIYNSIILPKIVV